MNAQFNADAAIWIVIIYTAFFLLEVWTKRKGDKDGL